MLPSRLPSKPAIMESGRQPRSRMEGGGGATHVEEGADEIEVAVALAPGIWGVVLEDLVEGGLDAVGEEGVLFEEAIGVLLIVEGHGGSGLRSRVRGGGVCGVPQC